MPHYTPKPQTPTERLNEMLRAPQPAPAPRPSPLQVQESPSGGVRVTPNVPGPVKPHVDVGQTPGAKGPSPEVQGGGVTYEKSFK